MGQKPPDKEISIILDRFTDLDIRQWQKYSDQEEEYNILITYYLDALRKAKYGELIASLTKKSGIEFSKKGWYRFVDAKYTLEPLSSIGSLRAGGRFNIGRDLVDLGSFPCLYIGENYDTSYCEYFGLKKTEDGLEGHELALRSSASFTAYRINFSLSNVFDLRKINNIKSIAKILSSFDIPKEMKKMAKDLGYEPPYIVRSPKELHATLLAPSWRRNPVQYDLPANSQIFGKMVKEAGFEAIIYPSTKYHGKSCLAVFPENLADGDSYVALQDEASEAVTHLRLNNDTWRKLSGRETEA